MATAVWPQALRGVGATPQAPVVIESPHTTIPAGTQSLNAQSVMDQVDIDNPLVAFTFQVMFDRADGKGPQQWGGALDFVGGPNLGKNGGISPPAGAIIGVAPLAGTAIPVWLRLTLPQPLNIGGTLTTS